MASTLSWTFLPLCDGGSDPLQGLRARKESVVRMADLADGGQSEGKMATLRPGPFDIRNRTRQRRVERGKCHSGVGCRGLTRRGKKMPRS